MFIFGRSIHPSFPHPSLAYACEILSAPVSIKAKKSSVISLTAGTRYEDATFVESLPWWEVFFFIDFHLFSENTFCTSLPSSRQWDCFRQHDYMFLFCFFGPPRPGSVPSISTYSSFVGALRGRAQYINVFWFPESCSCRSRWELSTVLSESFWEAVLVKILLF